MIGGSVTLTSKDRMAHMLESLKRTIHSQVLVGVPDENADRDSGKGGEINNAQLVYIHTHGARSQEMINQMRGLMYMGSTYSAAYSMYISAFGSPLWHIPPRPIIEPSIEAEDHKQAIADQLGHAAGAYMDEKPEEARMHLERAGQLGENYAKDWFDDPRNDWPPNAPRTIAAKGSESPLIDKGEMRKAITHVLREEA